MKMPIVILCLFSMFIPAFAEESQKIVDRKTCEQIRSEIAELSAIENPTSEEQDSLKQLNAQLRVSCAIKGNGRRTIARPGTTTGANTTPDVEESIAIVGVSALDEYVAAKKANCDKLNTEMEKLKSDTAKEYIVKEMQRYYNADCVTVTPIAEPVVVESVAVVTPTKTDAEIEAEFNANIAAGLCGDGTKPNRFGCCTDEVFRDMGNAQFACCPKTGDICFPPITKAQ